MSSFPETLAERYRFDSVIGSGGYAKVAKYTVINENKVVAIKQYHKCYFQNDLEINEFAILTRIAHPNVVYCFEVIRKTDFVYLVLEYIEGLTLDCLLKEHGLTARNPTGAGMYIEKSTAMSIIAQLFAALHFLHARRIIHRDVKLENIIFNEATGKITLIDFGSAKSTVFDPATTFCGTFVHMSPEYLDGKPYDCKTDIWAAGITVYRLVCGYPPFDGVRVVYNILAGNFRCPQWLSQDLVYIISNCLVVDRTYRYSAEQILFRFFPFEKETLCAALSQSVRDSFAYRVCCFNGQTRLKSCTFKVETFTAAITVMHHELDIYKTLPTPSFLRQMAACIFFINNQDDADIAQLLLQRYLDSSSIVFTCYGSDGLKIQFYTGQIEVRLYESNIEEYILLYFSSHIPEHGQPTGYELNVEAPLQRKRQGCC